MAATARGCAGRPFVGGHDPGCPNARPNRAPATGAEHEAAPRLSYWIDPGERLVRLVIRGAPSFERWEQTMIAALADPAYQAGFSFLVDRRLEEPPCSEYVRRVVGFLWLHLTELAGGRRAIVTWNPASYGMARVEKALGSDLPIPIEVFMDMDEAECWLLRRSTA